ncbi:MAG TPA: phosphosulfolactate synthase [Bacteroidia bacterium]|jgi:phosphosulfolactate synthase|nr:phosphosulfolactate synthase [Bacteroidia bacterium]
MNVQLSHLPKRTKKQRKDGLTMVMDKGLSLRQTEDLIETSADIIDLVKFGFGTSVITKNLTEKIKLFKEADIKVYFGGTLFESFLIRGQFDDYCKYIDKYKIDTVEVSDGSIEIEHGKKCEYIAKLAKNFTVLSEVGSKEEGILIHPNLWKNMMKDELSAGSWKVIAEARESGTVGIYRSSGHAHTALVSKIVSAVKQENIIWEAPKKSQQVWWIKFLGANVNLGNISPEESLPLETLRLGLRGDTFFHFLPKGLSKQIK